MSKTTNISAAADFLLDQCADLMITVALLHASSDSLLLRGPEGENITVDLVSSNLSSMLEQVLAALTIHFETLPVLTIGDSKEIRLLTPKVCLARLLPTVYSFTENRYGTAPGTETVRARFSAAIFRSLAHRPGAHHVSTAFLGLIDTPSGPLLAERVVEPANIEIRVKRYHIGSPLHRYRFTQYYPSARGGAAIQKWSRFDFPVVCFDWRHPLRDEFGNRLADEPLSDDYAGLWLDSPVRAKQVALDTFLWMESLFDRKGLRLIDCCFFIDRTGEVIFGEISPDCMRVRSSASDDSESLDKDKWRSGGTPQEVLSRYQRLQEALFGD